MITDAGFFRRLPKRVLFIFLLLTLPLFCMPALGQQTTAENASAALGQDGPAGPQGEENRRSSADGNRVIKLNRDPIPKMDPVIALLRSLTPDESKVHFVVDPETDVFVTNGRVVLIKAPASISQGKMQVKVQPWQGNRIEPYGIPEAIEQGMHVDAVEHKYRLINPRRIETPRPENPWEIAPRRIRE